MSDRQPPEDLPTRRRRPDIVVRRPPAERIAQQPHVRDVPDSTRRSEPQRPPPPPPSRPPSDPGSGPLSVPWWAFAIVILVVAGITCGLWWFALANRGDASTNLGPTPTPIFVVITSTPTLGPEAEQPQTDVTPETGQTPGAQSTPPTAPPQLPTQTSAPSEIGIGSTIAINGTEGDGLAIRQGPGVDYSYFFVGNDGDTFVIEDGPRDADGYIWWYIVDPADPNRAGWAVDIFMEIAS